MRAFRTRRALLETAEQKQSRLSADRQYRRQRLTDFYAKKTSEEKEAHLVSRSQYEVKRLADKRTKESAVEREERLRAKRAKEMNRRQNLRARETNAERYTRLESDLTSIGKTHSFFIRLPNTPFFLTYRAKRRARNDANMTTNRNCAVCGYKIVTQNWSHIAIKSFPNLHLLRPQNEVIPSSVLQISFSRFTRKNLC